MTSRTVLSRSLLAFLCLLLIACPSQGQDQTTAPAGLRFFSFGRAIHGRVQPGGWLVLTATVQNTSAQPLEARAVATLSGFPDLQNSRTLTLFPGTTETFELYVLVPQAIDQLKNVEVDVALYQVDAGVERLLDVQGVPMRNNLRMQVEQTNNLALTSLNDEPAPQFAWEWPFVEPFHNYEVLVASRVLSRNPRSLASFEHQPLPLTRMDWKDIGLMTVSDSRFFDDAASVEALIQFVNDGGRVWFMLDKIPCHLIQPFLGQGNSCAEVDQVELNRFLVDVHSAAVDLSEEDRTVDHDAPIVFKRVVHVGGTTSHSIDGWPAAIWMKVGYGEVLLTTLASQGWLRPGSESTDPQQSTKFRVTPWGLPLALAVHEPRLPQPISDAVGYPLELIGNPVLPRGLVGTILLAFVSLLMGVGVICFRIGELSKLGIYAPLLSLLAGGGLVLSSTWIRRDIPETVSSLQLIQVNQLGRAAAIREQSAVHLNSSAAMNLTSQADGYATVDTTVQSGIKRFDVGDLQQSQLSNIAWPPGSWRYQTTQLVDTPPLVATGRLKDSGLSIELPNELETFEDPVIGYAPGVPMIGNLAGRVVVADGSLMAEGERWIDETLISNEQRRRIDVYRQFFSGDARHLPPRHTLFGWSQPWEAAKWDHSNLTEVGSALIGLPLRLLRPTVGERVLIPAGLIQLRKDPRELAQTSAFNSNTGKWSTDMGLGISAYVQFLLPPEVLPFKAESLSLELNIKAPHRRVRLTSRSAGREPIEIVSLTGPSIPWKGLITDPEILSDALDGTLDLMLEISERTDVDVDDSPSSVVTWQIDAFRATAIGTRLSEADHRLVH
jgi:hypothetical protein